MKVNYTLPGLLPEAVLAPREEAGNEEQVEPFSAQLQRLRAPASTDWRAVLRLGMPPPGFGALTAPPAPSGIASRDAASQRAWWRDVLQRHRTALAPTAPGQSEPDQAIGHMLRLLYESQKREDQIFARHFAEDES
jgi:hypothetical protein